MLLATLLNLPALTNALAAPIRTLLQPDRAASAPLVGRQEFPEGACDPSHYRTFFNLLWTCATTILVFSWRSIHSNVPHPPAIGLLTNKWIITLCGILAPEFVWVWASKERIIANRIEKEVSDRSPDGYPWTLAHSFFLIMGGFMVDVGDSYEVLVYDPVAGALRTINGLPVMLPKISEEELQDLSKADAFAKFLVFLQITGFVLQLASRIKKALPITPLEIVTLSFLTSMVATLWMWLDKPSNVGYPLYFNRRGDRITSPSIPSQGWGILGWLKSLFMTPAILLEMIWMEGLGDHRQLNFGSTWFKVAFFLQCAYIFLLPGLAFCGFLISANSKKIITVWGFTYVAVPFPTQVLSSLWKLAAIIMVIGAYCLWIILLVPSSNAAKHGTRRLACYVVILAFIAARLTILVLSFMSLSNLPPGAFEVSPWVEWFPFIH